MSCSAVRADDSLKTMDTSICLHGITAFALYERWDRMVPDLFDLPRSRSLRTCRLVSPIEVKDRLAALGLHDAPFHLVVDDRRHVHHVEGVVPHVCALRLPPRALIHVAPGVLCPSPELCFIQLAQHICAIRSEMRDSRAGMGFRRFPWLDEVDLALWGFELCGTYLKDEEAPDTIRNTPRPLTSVGRIGALLRTLDGHGGIKLARRSLGLVQDGAHSLMETAMALQLTGPRRIGGMGLPHGMLNCRISTSTGDRWVDLGWPQHCVGIEYQGKRWHSDAERDDRRRNGIVGTGMNLYIARFRDLSDSELFYELAEGVARSLGERIRIRDRDFRARQRALWARVLPPVDRLV